MTREAVEAALEAGVELARELLGNTLYVKEELPNVDLPAELRSRVEGLCESLIGVKHDAFSELTEAAEALDSGGDITAAQERLARIEAWMVSELRRIGPVVDALDGASLAKPDCRLAYVLVAESMASVLGSLKRFRAAVAAIARQNV
jgi:hypothetical protein